MKVIILVFWVCLLSATWTQAQTIYIVSTEIEKHSVELKDILKGKMADKDIQIQRPSHILPGTTGIFVAVGPIALQSLLDRDIVGPIIPIFISKVSYQQLLLNNSLERYNIRPILSDPPLVLQLALIRAIFGKAKVGILLSQKTAFMEKDLVDAANTIGLKLKVKYFDSSLSNKRQIQKLISSDAEVLLALPDASIYNEKTAKSLVRTARRKNLLTIGYSTQLVDLGALATVHYDIDNIVQALVQNIHLIFNNDSAKFGNNHRTSHYPSNYNIAINNVVGRFMGIPRMREERLKKRIAKYMAKPVEK